MSQNTLTASQQIPEEEHNHGGSLLGPLLCWAVVFADIGTSVYYVPGILYGNVGNLAGFFVFLTMSVFVLLTLKYAEVTNRFPQGGGVVTVAASSLGKWFGALGGMFILVDYFLTASISSLSGMQYLSVVIPALGRSIHLPAFGWSVQLILLLITIGILVLLGILNWVGVSESAKVSLVGAVIAFASDIAILITVFTHLSLSQVFALFPQMFVGHAFSPGELLVGFAGSFLAFSGLESISQLSPVMKTPRKKVAGIALLLVVLTIGITSPLLTMFSTILQPSQAANPIDNAQLVSLLGGHWGNTFLQTEIAISASALLVFASNTAIIGAYHVFLALARLGFFPDFVTKRNKLRDTPHYSIMLATGIPIVVLIIVLGNITILGDMYAFGLLGAFTLTCLGMDIIRSREHRSERTAFQRKARIISRKASGEYNPDKVRLNGNASSHEQSLPSAEQKATTDKPLLHLWRRIDFWLGVLTTGLVLIAWSTNLVAKPLATLFGGSVTIIGMGIAFFNYRNQAQGHTPIHVTPLSGVELIPDAILAVLLTGQQEQNARVVQSAIQQADNRPLVLLYIGEPVNAPTPRPFEYYEPYLADESVLRALQQAESTSRHSNTNITPYLLYQTIRDVSPTKEADTIANIWQAMRPHELLIASEDVNMLHDINPDRVRYEWTPEGKVAHLISLW